MANGKLPEISNTRPKYDLLNTMVLTENPTTANGVGIPALINVFGIWDRGAIAEIWQKTGPLHTDWEKVDEIDSVGVESDTTDLLEEIVTSENAIGKAEDVSIIKRMVYPRPKDGVILPVAAQRAYYGEVLYSAVAKFHDGVTGLRKYVAYYGGGATGSMVAFSDDGITWDQEQVLAGVVAGAYHCKLTLVGTTLHFFYWDSTVSIYGPNATRHSTIDITTDCATALTDNPLSGTYIHGGAVMDLRRGTYGPSFVFYNPAPTNNPADPYSYQWCMIHNGTDGSNEGILFATSPDGYNFSIWNALVETIPRGLGLWDAWIGAVSVFIDANSLWHCFYSGGIGTGAGADSNYADGLGYASSIDGINWTKHPSNPVIFKSEAFKHWKRLYTPSFVDMGDYLDVYFTAKDQASNYRMAKFRIDSYL